MRLNLRLSTAEARFIELAAQRAGMSDGAYAARAAVDVAKGDVLPLPVDERAKMQAVAEARVSLSRIGNNLNQIAHVLNSGGDVTSDQLAAVLARVEAAVRRVDDASLALMEGRA